MDSLLDVVLGRTKLRKALARATASTDYFRAELERLQWLLADSGVPTESQWKITLEATQAEATELRKRLNEQTARTNAWKIIAITERKNHE